MSLFTENKPNNQQDQWEGKRNILDPPTEPSAFLTLVFADGVFVISLFMNMVPVHRNLR